jgi:flagellar hook assembly protein FlgD
VRIDTSVPRLEVLSSATGPLNPARKGTLARLALTSWSRVSAEILSPQGRPVYSMRTLLHGPGTIAAVRWNGRTSAGQPAPSGRYVLRITAVGRSGLRWQTQRPLEVLASAPSVSSSGLSQPYVYNPYNNALDGTEVVTLALSAPARVRLEALYNGQVVRSWALHAPAADSVISATWDGTMAGHVAPEGSYTFTAVIVDAAGNTARSTLGTIALDLRRIIVSLDAQQLWALDADRVLLTTLVTTGGPIAPTPVGDFQIIDRESPFTFRSPYPEGSFMWYPPSPTTFALLFQINGYFLHDAPWRSNFGPGSNAVAGKPGGNVTGTHGCINVPYNYMAWLYNWASMYTPVEIRNAVTPGNWPRPLG